jgi:hypothetical protein
MSKRILQVNVNLFVHNVIVVIYSQIQDVLHLTVNLTPFSPVLIVTLVQTVVHSGGNLVIREELSHVGQLEDQIKFHD